MEKIILVTGANGHLGNNLVRRLVGKGKHVRAGVRDIQNKTPFAGVDCDIVHADLLDHNSLDLALKGVDTLYQVAAAYKHWAKEPDKEIIQPNLTGTENILKAAARHQIRKIVYVSSITALGRDQLSMNETSWNQTPANPYYRSKTESEKLALNLAKQHDLFLVSVLPAAIIGPHCYRQLTPTMKILYSALNNKQPVDVSFHLNFVSVADVVDGMIAAAKKGRKGERYILGTNSSVSTTEIFRIAKSVSANVKIPVKLPKFAILALAFTMETASQITGKEPELTRNMINTYYKDNHTLDLSKSRAELGYEPHDPLTAIKSTLEYLNSSDYRQLADFQG